MTSVRIIANPNAAGGRARRVLPILEAALEGAGIPYSIRETEAPGHARRLGREARDGGSAPVLVVGGDGTVHEVAGGLLSGDPDSARPEIPALAVLPVGTGNDFHRMLRGAPRTPEGIPRLLREGVPRAFEVGTVRWSGGSASFVNLVGIGIDVEVLKRRAGFTALSGLPQYLAALGAALARFRAVPVTIVRSNGVGPSGEIRGPVLLAAVTVGPSVGGGFLLSPNARPDDGHLDLFVAERMGLLRILRYLPSILMGTLEHAKGIHSGPVTRVEIRAAPASSLRFELDGELMPDEVEWLEIGVRTGGLRVLELPEGGER